MVEAMMNRFRSRGWPPMPPQTPVLPIRRRTVSRSPRMGHLTGELTMFGGIQAGAKKPR